MCYWFIWCKSFLWLIVGLIVFLKKQQIITSLSTFFFFFFNSVRTFSLVTGIVAEQFLNSTATQLTYHGLCELTSTVQEGELCVFFRNNHFSTMIKFKVKASKVVLNTSR